MDADAQIVRSTFRFVDSAQVWRIKQVHSAARLIVQADERLFNSVFPAAANPAQVESRSIASMQVGNKS